jgi:(p)ppGpp synthase/HD superfamily hydrolase
MSLIPKAIEFAFSAHAGRTLPSGSPHVEHGLRVWERFRRHRPLGDLAFRRYEELCCVALLHDVIREGVADEEAVFAEFGAFVASGVARTSRPEPPDVADDPDLQLIIILDRVDTLACLAPALPPAELVRRAGELEQHCLPFAHALSSELAREVVFQLDDLRREPHLIQ